MSTTTKITVEAEVNAPVEIVWETWNAPDDIVKWNSADPGWHTTKSSNDLKVGGKFCSRMEAKDGSVGFDFEGVYDRVTPFSEIAYTMADGRTATTTFNTKGQTTHVATTFDAETQNDVEMQKMGWQAILDNFATYAESNYRQINQKS